jgi:hypothetical protein
MTRFKWTLAAMFLFLGQVALAADDIEDDDTLTAAQKEQLKQVQANLTAVTKDSKQTKQEKDAALNDSLRTVLVQNSQPSDMSIDKLAGNLAGNISQGNIGVRDSVLLTKKLMKFLNQGDFSIDSNRGLVKDVEGLVQTSGLSQDDRNQLYNAILTVVSTADGFKRNGK